MSHATHAETPSKKTQEIKIFHCLPILKKIQQSHLCKLDTITFSKKPLMTVQLTIGSEERSLSCSIMTPKIENMLS